jgi:hypothetical protein
MRISNQSGMKSCASSITTASKRSDAMFQRYDITDNRDKLAALEAARKFVELQPGEKPGVASIQR